MKDALRNIWHNRFLYFVIISYAVYSIGMIANG